MAAALDRSTRVEDHDLVAVPDGGQPMGHDQTAASSGPETLVDLGFDEGIERRGRLVEDQDGGIGGERPGDLEALALAARPVRSTLQDGAFVPPRSAGDVVVDRRV